MSLYQLTKSFDTAEAALADADPVTTTGIRKVNPLTIDADGDITRSELEELAMAERQQRGEQ